MYHECAHKLPFGCIRHSNHWSEMIYTTAPLILPTCITILSKFHNCSCFHSYLPNTMNVMARYQQKAFCGVYSNSGDIFLSACQGKTWGRLLSRWNVCETVLDCFTNISSTELKPQEISCISNYGEIIIRLSADFQNMYILSHEFVCTFVSSFCIVWIDDVSFFFIINLCWWCIAVTLYSSILNKYHSFWWPGISNGDTTIWHAAANM